MIYLGKFNNLSILRETSVGLFLGDEDGTDILLPNKYKPANYQLGDKLDVFCYLDHQERPVATTLKPYIERDQFALLRVAEVNEIGAFMDWGLEKHLLVPFKEQRFKMVEGQSYVVYCYLDEVTFRLVASNKLDKFLSNESIEFEIGDEVSALLTRESELGWDVIVNNTHKGLIYANEVFKKLSVGDQLKAYVKKIREDNKLDISLQPIGVAVIEPSAQKIVDYLSQNDGFMELHDKSSPEAIKDALEMSKKTFKKALGSLYKSKLVTLKEDGVYLNEH
jgi:predicted RNA-binding protein (virulence factor B family)